MFRNVAKAGMFGLMFLVVSCTVKEDQKLVKAVKAYPVLDLNVEKILEIKERFFKKKGYETNYSWQTQKVDEKTYNIIANINANQGKSEKKEKYVWTLTKNDLKSSKKSSFWKLKPSNKPAKKLMKIDKSRVDRWQN